MGHQQDNKEKVARMQESGQRSILPLRPAHTRLMIAYLGSYEREIRPVSAESLVEDWIFGGGITS